MKNGAKSLCRLAPTFSSTGSVILRGIIFFIMTSFLYCIFIQNTCNEFLYILHVMYITLITLWGHSKTCLALRDYQSEVLDEREKERDTQILRIDWELWDSFVHSIIVNSLPLYVDYCKLACFFNNSGAIVLMIELRLASTYPRERY